MDSEELGRVLHDMAFMQSLPEPLRGEVSRILQSISVLRTIPLGDAWIREGEKTKNMGYILVQGSVAIRKASGQQHAEEAPELIGEIIQYNPAHSRAATVVATADCVVMRFEWDEFWVKCGESLSDGELQSLRSAVESFAWEHFTR
jgi:CRP-like cAMP-binding protein